MAQMVQQMNQEMQRCIKACLDCHSVCLETVRYCLEKGEGMRSRAISGCCSTALRFVRRAPILCYGNPTCIRKPAQSVRRSARRARAIVMPLGTMRR